MHRVIRNELRLDVCIVPVSPTLLTFGDDGHFVRCLHPRGGSPTAYLPGATLKGALRAAAEQRMNAAALLPTVPCAAESMRGADGATIYRALCGLCRIFGTGTLSSHLAITDAYPADAMDTLPWHTLPDGSACESALGAAFYATLTLRNFERWQIGLLAGLLAQINQGAVTLGARGDGLGRVMFRFNAALITYFGFYDADTQAALSERLHGVGALLGSAEAAAEYQFIYADVGDWPDLPSDAAFSAGFGFAEVCIEGDSRAVHGRIARVLDAQMPAWEAYAADHVRCL